jgi:two-component system, LytTR family, response regulator
MEKLLNGYVLKVAIPSSKGLEFIDVNTIVRIEAQRSYCEVFLSNGKKMIVSKCLNDFDQILKNKTFMRVHNSHLVNLNYVRMFVRGDGGYLELTDTSCVPVARNRKDQFMDSMKEICI